MSPNAAETAAIGIAEDELWKVMQRIGGRLRTVFAGFEDDARLYISNHFPRLHVEPNEQSTAAPDAYLESPSGDKEIHTGNGNYVAVDNEMNPLEAADDDDDDDDYAHVPLSRPTDDAIKQAWVAYALQQDSDGGQSNWINNPDTTKADLIAEYGDE